MRQSIRLQVSRTRGAAITFNLFMVLQLRVFCTLAVEMTKLLFYMRRPNINALFFFLDSRTWHLFWFSNENNLQNISKIGIKWYAFSSKRKSISSSLDFHKEREHQPPACDILISFYVSLLHNMPSSMLPQHTNTHILRNQQRQGWKQTKHCIASQIRYGESRRNPNKINAKPGFPLIFALEHCARELK